MRRAKPVPPNHRILLVEATLREAGLRVTQARVRVLSTLLDSTAPLLHQALHVLLPDIDRVTLYRVLDDLATAGLAQKIAANDRAFRYCATLAMTNASQGLGHGHFKCSGCGKIFCLAPAPKTRRLIAQLQRSLQQSATPGFEGQEIELTIKGRCADCA